MIIGYLMYIYLYKEQVASGDIQIAEWRSLEVREGGDMVQIALGKSVGYS